MGYPPPLPYSEYVDRSGTDMRQFLTRCALFFLIGCSVVGCGSLDRTFVFCPRRYPAGDWGPGGTNFEDAWFEAPDGTRLHGWFAEAANPRAVVLYAHGNAGSVADRADVL